MGKLFLKCSHNIQDITDKYREFNDYVCPIVEYGETKLEYPFNLFLSAQITFYCKFHEANLAIADRKYLLCGQFSIVASIMTTQSVKWSIPSMYFGWT